MAVTKRSRKKNNKKNIFTKVKKYYKKVKKAFFEIYGLNVFWIASPFLLMEVFLLIIRSNINYSNYLFISPLLFTFTWVLLFVGLSICLKKWIGKLLYILFNLLFMALFLVNCIYYSTMDSFFDFTLLNAASEGAPYMWDSIKNCNKLVYVAFIIVIIFAVIGYKKIGKVEKTDYKRLLKVFIIFIVMHIVTPITYGTANKNLTWSSWRNPKNIYKSFNDANKSMKITGFYEYSFRNFYVTFLKSKTSVNEEDMQFLDTAYEVENNPKNSYTGKLKGKNLILIQLEGTDNWLINKNDTPTLYKLMNEGINFKKHYSFYNGGGSTFNSEFAVNTGFVTPLSYTQNAYAFNKNTFPYTLANVFKEKGYSVNAFHMNTGEYYSRTVNYKNWGYDNYYGLIDEETYNNESYMLDRELILNENYSNLMFREDGLFVDYIIAYSGHTPFTNTKGVCKQLYDLDKKAEEEAKEKSKSKDKNKNKNKNKTKVKEEKKTSEFVLMSEEECVRRQATETDYMVKLLINKLKDKKLLDNTAIVVFTDHYLYTLTDKTILDQYKDTSNNLINNTPWFIWSNDINKTKVTKVTSQLNILPTILNLYGVKFNANNYIGKDALGRKYEGLVFFNDYSWYNGTVYVENGIVANNKKIDKNALEEKNEYVNYLAKKNDLTLKYNYFKTKIKE